ncbi:GOLPH3/VPS74 family protein [Actinotalea solisilvae]|uniref:GOLPH3/VPS74 family protein n=1 Tax=Actinotalea solisilvae TaxID=2072922 RepID=UPI0018F25859|nr:GPP34 family phosphoprotein [Actinotalea solisilvae]
MILADDLLLLLTDDRSGRPAETGVRLENVVAGAALTELLLLSRVRLTGPGESVRAGRVVVEDATPVGDPLLDEALRRVGHGTPKAPHTLLAHLRPGLLEALRARLVERGVLRVEAGRVLGLFPRTSWPAEDSTHEAQLRERLREVLALGREPSEREAGVVALLHAVNRVQNVLGDLGVPGGQVRSRATTIAQRHVGADAVRRANNALGPNDAVMAVAELGVAGLG